MVSCERIRQAIRRESLGGWLFYNHLHRDRIADRILSINPAAPNTRPWLYLFYADREPVKIVHLIEDTLLDHLAGGKRIYRGREEFQAILAAEADPAVGWGSHFSARAPRLSFLDHGTALFLAELGFTLLPGDRLIQHVLGTLTADEIRTHEAASAALHEIVRVVWKRIADAFRGGRKTVAPAPALSEGRIHGWLQDLFAEHGLETEWPLIVGAGKNTTFPHYFPEGEGATLHPGDLVQLDIWGKKNSQRAIYADISWVGIIASAVPERVNKVFHAVRDARDKTVRLIADELVAGRAPAGAALDRFTESVLREHGYGEFIRHRTGHAIDIEVHGVGVNLDGREFPEERTLQEGSCFSVEPGLYLPDFGIRSEIDVYIKDGRPAVSGGTPQQELLTIE